MPERTKEQDRLYQKYRTEMYHFGDSKITLELSIQELMSFIGCCQLGMRHPAYNGPSRQISEKIILRLRDKLKGYPTLQQSINMGFDSENDV